MNMSACVLDQVSSAGAHRSTVALSAEQYLWRSPVFLLPTGIVWAVIRVWSDFTTLLLFLASNSQSMRKHDDEAVCCFPLQFPPRISTTDDHLVLFSSVVFELNVASLSASMLENLPFPFIHQFIYLRIGNVSVIDSWIPISNILQFIFVCNYFGSNIWSVKSYSENSFILPLQSLVGTSIFSLIRCFRLILHLSCPAFLGRILVPFNRIRDQALGAECAHGSWSSFLCTPYTRQMEARNACAHPVKLMCVHATHTHTHTAYNHIFKQTHGVHNITFTYLETRTLTCLCVLHLSAIFISVVSLVPVALVYFLPCLNL